MGGAVFVARGGAVTLAVVVAVVVTVVFLAPSPWLIVVTGRGHGAVFGCWQRQRQSSVSRIWVIGLRHHR